jgi:hypothetical protein
MTYRPPSRRKLTRVSALFLFAAALSLSACGRVDFDDATEATVGLPVVLTEAQRITGRLKQAKLVTDEELERLDTNLREAQDSTGTFVAEVRQGLAGEKPDTEENRKALVDSFEKVFVATETFKLTVSSLGNASARESYRAVLSMVDTDVGNAAAALGCEKINPTCVRCSEGRLNCKK